MNRSEITFSLLGLKHGFSVKDMIKFVNENQYWSKDSIEEYQYGALNKLIHHVYHNVPFYNKVLKNAGATPEDIKSIKDIKIVFPVIDKHLIQKQFSDFVASNAREFSPMERSTGGTTGVPFKYYNDKLSWGLNWATKIRTFSWGGYIFGKDRIAVLKGGSMERKGKFSPQTMLWKQLHNYYTVPIMNMNIESMEFHFRQILKHKIVFIRGFPSALYIFARFIQSRGFKIKMRGVFTSAEVLYPHQRALIESVFGCGIIDAYGCGDGMAGANQCEHKARYHVNIETSIMELLSSDYQNDVLPGEQGEIVLTSLHDFAMPLIRYAPGDMAVVSKENCACNRTLPLLDKIIGRTADVFELPNGRILNGLSIPFEDWTDKIERFQLIHEKPELIILKLIPTRLYNEHDTEKISNLIKHHAGDGIRVEVNLVNEIKQTAAGKFKYIVSKVINA